MKVWVPPIIGTGTFLGLTAATSVGAGIVPDKDDTGEVIAAGAIASAGIGVAAATAAWFLPGAKSGGVNALSVAAAISTGSFGAAAGSAAIGSLVANTREG